MNNFIYFSRRRIRSHSSTYGSVISFYQSINSGNPDQKRSHIRTGFKKDAFCMCFLKQRVRIHKISINLVHHKIRGITCIILKCVAFMISIARVQRRNVFQHSVPFGNHRIPDRRRCDKPTLKILFPTKFEPCKMSYPISSDMVK